MRNRSFQHPSAIVTKRKNNHQRYYNKEDLTHA
jgi:hypothetical protein